MTEEVTRTEIMRAIEELRKDVQELRDSVSKGKGAVQALFWVGGILGVIAAWFSAFRH